MGQMTNISFKEPVQRFLKVEVWKEVIFPPLDLKIWTWTDWLTRLRIVLRAEECLCHLPPLLPLGRRQRVARVGLGQRRRRAAPAQQPERAALEVGGAPEMNRKNGGVKFSQGTFAQD